MARQNHDYGFDLILGLVLGLFSGLIVGIVWAPKPGKELQGDVQRFVKKLPNDLNDGLSKSKMGLENKLEQRSFRKQALRMADAKRREALEAGAYEY